MNTRQRRRRGIADDYLELIRCFPLREIRSEKELEAAHAVLRPLFLRDEKTLSDGESDYLSALGVLVHDYEQRHYPMPPDTRSPLQRLQHLLEESGTTPTRLRRILDASQSLVSLILNGKRQLSKTNIRKLADHFKLDPSYFF